ncbi:hypothetical protein LCGC14_0752940 [marine sediment metagenome]|uniref:Uncharacterized protein n=1 Tax=marine sediment metagenome TaxID=412755 RepID=A0A0F9Q3G2_9ZZZZ
MGYGIHVEKAEKTKKECMCPMCMLDQTSYARYMRSLAKSDMVKSLLAETPDISDHELGTYGFEWFMSNRYEIGLLGIATPLVVIMANAFAAALRDTAIKIRKEKE